jgi:hypothetical protein
LKVEPPASNLALYKLVIDKAVNKLHHALSGGLRQCNTTNVSTLKDVRDLKSVLEESIERLITKKSMGEILHAALDFSIPKRPASQITTEKNPRVEQVSMFARLSKDSQEATSTTTATAPTIIMTTPTPIAAAPIIQATAVRDIVVEQEVLPLTKEAKESEIDTNAAILPNW